MKTNELLQRVSRFGLAVPRLVRLGVRLDFWGRMPERPQMKQYLTDRNFFFVDFAVFAAFDRFRELTFVI